MSAAIKSLLILLGAVPLVIFLGNELGSGEFVVPILVCGLIVATMGVSIFFREQRLECLTLALLLAGYIVGSRGFAQVAIVQPLFIGEMGLALITLLLASRFVLARETISMAHPVAKLVCAYFLLALVRFGYDARSYGIDAARDFALVYYALFFFIALRLGSSETSSRFLDKTLAWAFSLQSIVAVILLFRPEWLEQALPIKGVGLFTQKADLITTTSAMGVLFLFLRPELVRLNWLRQLLILILLSTVIVGTSRAPLIGLAATGGLLCFAGRRRILVYPALLGGVGLFCFLLVTTLMPDSGIDDSVVHLKDKVVSITDFSNSYNYSSEIGEIKGANNDFRRFLWKSVFDETIEENPFFGRGFGYDFLIRFEQTYGRGHWENLRSAHNYYVTLFGRMGILGVAVFSIISIYVLRGGFQAAGEVRRGVGGTKALAYWCCAWVVLISGFLGVVLEGPMGAIPFWSFLGLAVAASQEVVPVEEPELDLIPEPLVRSRNRELAGVPH